MYTKIDLSSAYLQLEMTEESKKFTTINTHKGLYQLQHLSFGIKPAPVIFQKTMDEILMGCKDTKCNIDDVLIKGDTLDEHYVNLEKVLIRLEDHNIMANLIQCVFESPAVEFVGHLVDEEGIRPTDDHIKDITNLCAPNSVEELQPLIGLVNYYAKFLPLRANLLSPMYRLLMKDTPWSGRPQESEDALNEVKRKLSSSPVIHYDPKKPISVACDASPYGIGTVLLHIMENGAEKPVAYASHTLKLAERNCA